jgi:hypothetical protein
MNIRIGDEWVDPYKAQRSWPQNTKNLTPQDLLNGIETLYKSSKGRYYIITERSSHKPEGRFVSNQEAATWLLDNGHDLPDDLKEYQVEIE